MPNCTFLVYAHNRNKYVMMKKRNTKKPNKHERTKKNENNNSELLKYHKIQNKHIPKIKLSEMIIVHIPFLIYRPSCTIAGCLYFPILLITIAPALSFYTLLVLQTFHFFDIRIYYQITPSQIH